MIKDKHDKAKDILTYYHAEGDETNEFVQLEYSEIRVAMALEKEADKTGWADLVRTQGNRKRIGIITALAFFSQWSGNGLISYYLHYVMNDVGITNPQTQLGVNAGMNTENLVVNVAFSFTADYFGRRPLFLASTFGTFITWIPWTIISARYDISPQKGLAYGFILFTYLYSLGYGIKYGALILQHLFNITNSGSSLTTVPHLGLVSRRTTRPKSCRMVSEPRATRGPTFACLLPCFSISISTVSRWTQCTGIITSFTASSWRLSLSLSISSSSRLATRLLRKLPNISMEMRPSMLVMRPPPKSRNLLSWSPMRNGAYARVT